MCWTSPERVLPATTRVHVATHFGGPNREAPWADVHFRHGHEPVHDRAHTVLAAPGGDDPGRPRRAGRVALRPLAGARRLDRRSGRANGIAERIPSCSCIRANFRLL